MERKIGYRSPWTNHYYPSLSSSSSSFTTATNNNNNNNNRTTENEEVEDDEIMGLRPSAALRILEIQANEVFESYTKLYYGQKNNDNNDDEVDEKNEIVSSVYLWDKEGGGGGGGGGNNNSASSNSSNNSNSVFKKGFGGCFLIKKQIHIPNQQVGNWNSIHRVNFGPVINGYSKYVLSSTILVSIDVTIEAASTTTNTSTTNTTTNSEGCNSQTVIQISGSLSKDMEQTHAVKTPTDHIRSIGRMIEDVEIELRTHLDVLYIQRTKEIFDTLRVSDSPWRGGGQGTSSGTRRRTGGGSSGSRSSSSGMMPMVGMHGLPAAAQNEMNAALMARFKKSNPS
jgi:capping protein beta